MLKENTPTIVTERLVLRKFTESDVRDMLLLYSDEEVNRFLPWFPSKTISEVTKYLHESIFLCYKKEIAYCYAICQKSDDCVIGYIHLNDIGGSNDIGYGLRKEFWNMGITTEACAAVVEKLRDSGLAFITATHDVNNPHSGDVMKKIGMTYRYSYEERWQPKDLLVTFRLYELDFENKSEHTYMKYWNSYNNHFVENGI